MSFLASFGNHCAICWAINDACGQSTTIRPVDNRSEPNNCLVRYLLTFVNYDENDWYQLLPLAEHAYTNSATNAHKITLFIANYAFDPLLGGSFRMRYSDS